MVDFSVSFPSLSTLSWDTFMTLKGAQVWDKILRLIYDNLSIFREDKKVCNHLLGQGDGCNLCLENPRNWSDWDRIKSNFPLPCDRTFEFNKVMQSKLISP